MKRLIPETKKPIPVWWLILWNFMIVLVYVPFACVSLIVLKLAIPFQVIFLIYPVSVLLMSVCIKQRLKSDRWHGSLYIKFHYWIYLPFLVGSSVLFVACTL